MNASVKQYLHLLRIANRYGVQLDFKPSEIDMHFVTPITAAAESRFRAECAWVFGAYHPCHRYNQRVKS